MRLPAPRFLDDESCDFAIVRALRADGYDVVALTEVMTRSVDALVIELQGAFTVVQPGQIRITRPPPAAR